MMIYKNKTGNRIFRSKALRIGYQTQDFRTESLDGLTIFLTYQLPDHFPVKEKLGFFLTYNVYKLLLILRL